MPGLEDAVRHFETAADHGYGDSSYPSVLEKSRGGSKNPEEVERYCKMAADQGHAHAQDNDGVCLLNGLGVEQNLREVASYFLVLAPYIAIYVNELSIY